MTVLDFEWPGSTTVDRQTVDSGARGVRAVQLIRRAFDPESDAVLAQLIRFALVGGLSNILYVAAFIGLDSDGSILANVVGSIVSTAVANEMHRRLTFHASGRVSWLTAQWEGGGLALIGIVVSSASLAMLNFLFPGTSGIVQALFVIGVSAIVGGLRFLALRGWVF
ncbi:GtrA family protein [Antrihabitans cavernicola]|uniref:GtrA family protein n=1 Tax=Antrihabitans cavernicola TaxID=2495913 RepID=A0A5A7SCI5_9NOCA|nr:GtrA family protein [Spelaeibacter cavernicola]KAA0023284.1 GtrA family protein [Spelaeibacter cavernicola]